MVPLLGQVLSISSHVTHGYVGNRATVFPLQYYGWDVDEIYTTNFSNHPGYGKLKKATIDAQLVQELFQGLEGIIDSQSLYDMILIGYCPSAEMMALVYEKVEILKRRAGGKAPVLVIDPVLGDNGKMYVAPEIVDVHAKFLPLSQAQLTTPNQFELEVLTGSKVDSRQSARQALLVFWEKYHVPFVVISSAVLDGEMYSVGFAGPDTEPFFIPICQIDCRFSGCGDVFTALLAHSFCANGNSLSAEVLQKVVSQVHGILSISYKCEESRIGETPTVVKDIKLIQSSKVFQD